MYEKKVVSGHSLKHTFSKTKTFITTLYKTYQHHCTYPDPTQCPNYHGPTGSCLNPEVTCHYRKNNHRKDINHHEI